MQHPDPSEKHGSCSALPRSWQQRSRVADARPDSCIHTVWNVVPKDLHGRFCVGVIGRFEAQLGQAQACEEQLEDAYEMTQRQAHITHHPCTHVKSFNIM